MLGIIRKVLTRAFKENNKIFGLLFLTCDKMVKNQKPEKLIIGEKFCLGAQVKK